MTSSTASPVAPATAPAFAVARATTPRPAEERAAVLAALASSGGFGEVFTDHMARITWSTDAGWSGHRVEPYAPLELDPAAAVLHYGQEIFEGLKAYRHPDGSVWTFRPQANAERFARSARRLALPELPVADFIGSLEALVAVDEAWVPGAPETSLYLRPFMIASEAFLGVRPARRIDYLVIASPVGPYFKAGLAPVSIWVERDQRRAGPGGTGAAKCMGNYAASLAAQQVAYSRGCEQVCFLDGDENLEELGGMNVVLVLADGTAVTPALGTILAGVTRDSVLTILRDAGHRVVERAVPLAEVRAGLADGTVREVFACGTGAVVSPIGRLVGEDFDLPVADGGIGPVTAAVRRELTDVQHGRAADTRGWMHPLVHVAGVGQA
ncbi:branched-chain amino acid aminotransferase [Actinotalea fermentans]|uniref:branched-chain-amino-acid transaminase n=1 Tax=Actinotalea fermentans TaxID=43671 RepID=A0A511YTA6_9CELL|nr:branched-chain amino acid aminotransferase [Actinotalea fermentans]KGM17136.1 branched-chain amino acid aminotransferase [Actinotalea fermentans ATCC 43279 = JCM 9966 = DSM 3133]GEN78433.1 branched-chain-amino-acid aminotransferase [Actinotalea fermentans]